MFKINKIIKKIITAGLLCFIPSPAFAGMPIIRSISLLYWSDPLLILITASIGFYIALKFHSLPEEIGKMKLYLLLVPISLVALPLSWMLEAIYEAVAFPHMLYNENANSVIRWLANPAYWSVDDNPEQRTIMRIGLLTVAFVISVCYQRFLLKMITKQSEAINNIKGPLIIACFAYGILICLFFTPFFPYTDLIWPR